MIFWKKPSPVKQPSAMRAKLVPQHMVLLLGIVVPLTTVLATTESSLAATNQFFCGISPQGLFTTYATTPRGDVPIVRWKTWEFGKSGYTPAQRCKEVSGRFQSYHQQGTLRSITTGIQNGYPVICVSSPNGNGCQGLLFTLKSGANASQVLQRLFDIGDGKATGPIFESSSGAASSSFNGSVNVQQLLNQRATETAQPLSGSAPPSKPEAPTNTGRIW